MRLARSAVVVIAGLVSAVLLWGGMVTAAYASDDRWTGPDKAKHFTASFLISTVAYNFYLRNTSWNERSVRTAAFISTLAVGAAKECMDDEFSWKDMGANAAGAGLGIAVAIEF
jgi:putative lipoprotein